MFEKSDCYLANWLGQQACKGFWSRNKYKNSPIFDLVRIAQIDCKFWKYWSWNFRIVFALRIVFLSTMMATNAAVWRTFVWAGKSLCSNKTEFGDCKCIPKDPGSCLGISGLHTEQRWFEDDSSKTEKAFFAATTFEQMSLGKVQKNQGRKGLGRLKADLVGLRVRNTWFARAMLSDPTQSLPKLEKTCAEFLVAREIFGDDVNVFFKKERDCLLVAHFPDI